MKEKHKFTLEFSNCFFFCRNVELLRSSSEFSLSITNKNLHKPTYFTATNISILDPTYFGMKIENYPNFTFENLQIKSKTIKIIKLKCYYIQ